MDKDQWQRIEKVFYSAMELPPNERDDFVRRTCADDEELRREVQTLLEANRNTEDFLDSPVATPQEPAVISPTKTKYCPKCSQTYPKSQRFCENDQEILSLKDPYHLVGRTLMEKYRITALVGLGGMGAVYYAHHLGIDRRVALKILQPNVAIGNEYVVELFEREAKLAGRLTHENIVDVKDAGHTPDGIAYIAMEWLEGRTLDEELSNQGRFGFKRAIGVIKQITAALGEAHSKRVIHRDLKPANIMLLDTPDGRDHVKVLDFGIGKIIEETTANSPVSALVGTPQYASPEQLTVGAHVDGRSDIYSLGVIFYRLLGGLLPFNCSSMGELLQMQLTAAPKPLSAIRPETPPAIENLINGMLAKEPAARPQNVGEIQKRLDQILGQLKLEELDRVDTEATTRAAEVINPNMPELIEHTTEEILGNSPPKPDRNSQTRLRSAPKQAGEMVTTSNVSGTAARSRSHFLYGVTIVVALLAGGYGLYRYRFNDGQNVQERAAIPSPTPAQISATDSQPKPTASAIPEVSPTPTVNRVEMQANQRKAAEHLQRARDLYQQGEYQSALRECNESLRLNPRQAEARQLQRKVNEIIKVLNRR
ncbi:MAG: serine/threonine protein kinase [Blastocatellales bacterium]